MEFENQLNAAHSIGSHDIRTIMYDLYMTHGDIKLDLDYGEDEIRRAQNEIKSERVDEYVFPSICSLELDSPVQEKYQAIGTYDKYDRDFVHLSSEPNVIRQYSPYKMAVNTTPMKSNTRGGGAIELFTFRCPGDPAGRLIQCQWRGNKSVVS
jgi:hypothetical protein